MNNDQLGMSEKLKQWRAENANAPKARSTNSNNMGPKAPLPTAQLCHSTRDRVSVYESSRHAIRTIEGSCSHSSFTISLIT